MRDIVIYFITKVEIMAPEGLAKENFTLYLPVLDGVDFKHGDTVGVRMRARALRD